MEEENVPNWLSVIVAKNRAEYEQFMQKVQAKHQEFMQWMQASHEEFIQKMVQQTAILDTKNSTSTSPTSIIEKTDNNMQHDAGAKKEIYMKEHSSKGMENPKNFQEEYGGKNERAESGEGFSSCPLRTRSIFGPQTGSSSSTCGTASVSVTPSISAGASSMSAIDSTSASGFRKSTFGRKYLFRGKSRSRRKSLIREFGSPNPTQTSSSSSPFGATSTSVFGSTSTPAFGSKTPSFNIMNVPAFDAPSFSTSEASSMPSFVSCSTPAFGQSATAVGQTSAAKFASTPSSTSYQAEPAYRTQHFAAAIQRQPFNVAISIPEFGYISIPVFGSHSIPAFGTTTTPFGPTNVPTVGTPSTSISEASSMPSFGFCSTRAFDLSATAFGATAPTFGFNASPSGSQGSKLGTPSTTSSFITKGFGRIPSGNLRGSGLKSYKTTDEADNWQTPGKFISISAMPEFEDQSHEELRWADYQLGNKGGNDFRMERINISGLTIGK